MVQICSRYPPSILLKPKSQVRLHACTIGQAATVIWDNADRQDFSKRWKMERMIDVVQLNFI